MSRINGTASLQAVTGIILGSASDTVPAYIFQGYDPWRDPRLFLICYCKMRRTWLEYILFFKNPWSTRIQ